MALSRNKVIEEKDIRSAAGWWEKTKRVIAALRHEQEHLMQEYQQYLDLAARRSSLASEDDISYLTEELKLKKKRTHDEEKVMRSICSQLRYYAWRTLRELKSAEEINGRILTEIDEDEKKREQLIALLEKTGSAPPSPLQLHADLLEKAKETTMLNHLNNLIPLLQQLMATQSKALIEECTLGTARRQKTGRTIEKRGQAADAAFSGLIRC